MSTRLTVAAETPTVAAISLPGMRWRRRRVCPRTGRKWVNRFEQEGLAGLQDRSSRPHRLRQPTPPEVIERIESEEALRKPPVPSGVSDQSRNAVDAWSKLMTVFAGHGSNRFKQFSPH